MGPVVASPTGLACQKPSQNDQGRRGPGPIRRASGERRMRSPCPSQRALALALISLLMPEVLARPAARPQPEQAAEATQQFKENQFFGDWGGRRTALWEQGIDAKFLLITDPYGNASGGLGKLWPTRLRTPKNVSTVQSDPFFVL